MTNQAQTERRIDTAPATQPQTFAGLPDIRSSMAQFRREYGESRVKALSAMVGDRRVEVVVRAPTRLEHDRHTATVLKIREGKTETAMTATRQLLLTCTLAPDAAALAATLDEYPALADKFGETLLDMAGAEAEVREETF
ncbi:hypothetical protein ACFP81_10685 [Deinococcus lacus]|uniref:DUF6848 domain-containing protein n=1 Tax=Deinococcus lacus TaxID=392561 RepID=A0ABW1YHS6_9DEIO